LTPREERIVSGVLSGETVKASIRAAGGNPNSDSYRRRLRTGGDMHAALMRAWSKQGITLTRVARRHREALDALETKLHTHQGHVIERTDLVAHGTRLEAVELAYRVTGALKERDDESASTQVPAVQITLEAPAGGTGPGPGSDAVAELPVLRVALYPPGGNGGNGHGGNGA